MVNLKNEGEEMNKEIERKYAIKYLPEDIKIEQIEEIEQAFLYEDRNTCVRIRRIQTKQEINYIYTVKTKGDIPRGEQINSKYEIENNITKEYYETLLPKKISNQIRKTRIVVPIANHLKVEIDIYYDYLQGFLTAEVEFPNEETAKQFKQPEWLGEEIGYQELSNRKLARMNEEQFKSKVSEEFMKNNKKVIEKLNQLIKKCY